MYFYLIMGSLFALILLFGIWVQIQGMRTIFGNSYEQILSEVERGKKRVAGWRFDLTMFVLGNFVLWEVGIWQKVFLLIGFNLINLLKLVQDYGLYWLAKWRLHKLKPQMGQHECSGN